MHTGEFFKLLKYHIDCESCAKPSTPTTMTATCGPIVDKDTWTILPGLLDGFYCGPNEFEIESDVSITTLNIKKKEFVRFQPSSNRHLVAVVRGFVSIGGCNHPKDVYEEKKCVAEVLAGQIVMATGLMGIQATLDSAVVVFSFDKIPSVEKTEIEVIARFAKRTLPELGVIFAYNPRASTPYITEDDIKELPAGLVNANLEHTLITLEMLETKPISFSEGGPKYGGMPAGRLKIQRNKRPQDNSTYGVGVLAVAVAKRPPKQFDPATLVPAFSLKNWKLRLNELDSVHDPLYKNKSVEVTLNSLNVGGVIPNEVHHDTDQIIMVVSGAATVLIRTKDGVGGTFLLTEGTSIRVPAHADHEVRQSGSEKLKFISIYPKADDAK